MEVVPTVHGPSIRQQSRPMPRPTIPGPWVKNDNPSNNIVVLFRNCDTLPNQLCVCLFNAQSVGNSKKRSEIFNFISDYDVDVMLLTETWLRESGDDAKCKDLTPSGHKLFSFPRSYCSTAKGRDLTPPGHKLFSFPRSYCSTAKCRDLAPPGYKLFSFPRSYCSTAKCRDLTPPGYKLFSFPQSYCSTAKCRDLTPPGYKLFSFPRSYCSTAKRGGGLAFIIKVSMCDHCSSTVSFPFPHISFELAQVTLGLNKQDISFYCVYRPPPSKTNKMTDLYFSTNFLFFLSIVSMIRTASSLQVTLVLILKISVFLTPRKFVISLICLALYRLSVSRPTGMATL